MGLQAADASHEDHFSLFADGEGGPSTDCISFVRRSTMVSSPRADSIFLCSLYHGFDL